MLIATVILCLLSAAAVWVAYAPKTEPDSSAPHVKAWMEALDAENSSLGRLLLNASRPFSSMEFMRREAASPAWENLHKMVSASGAYGASVEVFLAVQAAAIVAGLMVLAAASAYTALSGDGNMVLYGGIAAGAAVAAWPWNMVSKGAKKKEDLVADQLPMFAELLQMPLASGMGIMPSLAFTADHADGLVADEVRRMVEFVRTNPGAETTAFQAASDRLGTPEARMFFTAVLQAQLEGAKVADQLARQAESLRRTSYERKLRAIKRVPNRLVLIMFFHELPLLYVVPLVPFIISMGAI